MPRTIPLAALTFFLAASAIKAQETNDPQLRARLHDEVARILSHSVPLLPSGDTLVSWAKQGPILYHTIAADSSLVASSLVRNDPFVGVVTTHWSGPRLLGFEAQWRERDSVTVDLRGKVSGDVVRITGTHQLQFTLPSSLWAVADYGMDEHLVPILRSLRPGGPPQQVIVLRPYKLKWDTVSVAAVVGPSTLVGIITAGPKDTTRMLLTPAGRLVYVERNGGAWVQRPLELTPLDSVYHALLAPGARRP